MSQAYLHRKEFPRRIGPRMLTFSQVMSSFGAPRSKSTSKYFPDSSIGITLTTLCHSKIQDHILHDCNHRNRRVHPQNQQHRFELKLKLITITRLLPTFSDSLQSPLPRRVPITGRLDRRPPRPQRIDNPHLGDADSRTSLYMGSLHPPRSQTLYPWTIRDRPPSWVYRCRPGSCRTNSVRHWKRNVFQGMYWMELPTYLWDWEVDPGSVLGDGG
jgi:hypothetical protein